MLTVDTSELKSQLKEQTAKKSYGSIHSVYRGKESPKGPKLIVCV